MDETFQGLLRTTTVMVCHRNVHLYGPKSNSEVYGTIFEKGQQLIHFKIDKP
jgi:hypothetical protein